jgi:hypothetical protein
MSEQKEYSFLNYLDVYTKEIITPGSNEKVVIRPLTTNQLKKLLVNEDEDDPIKGDEILDDILKYCIVNDVNIDDLLLQDRYFIFIEIRKLTKGSKYSYEYNCSKCKCESIQNIDLENLELINLDNTKISEPVEIANGKVKIYLKHITRLEQKKAYSNLKLKNKTEVERAVEMIIANIAASIYKIETPEGSEENINFNILFNMVGNLPSKEYDKLKK